MVFKIPLVLAVVVSFSLAVSPALAGTLTVPDELTLLFSNGKKVPKSFFRHTNSIDITAGPNNIVVKYDDIISGDFSDDHTVVESLPFALNFSAQSDVDYQINMALPRNEEQAKKFAIKPVVTLRDSEHRLVPLEIEYQKSEEQEKLAELFRPGTEEVPNTPVNRDVAVKSLPSVKKDVVENMTPAHKSSKRQEVMNPQALEMLNYWWRQASAAQRLEFQKSIDTE